MRPKQRPLMNINQKFKKNQMDESTNRIKQIKKTVLTQIRALRPDPSATPQEAIEALVRQAQFYTNFLLSRHDPSKKLKVSQTKRRGHFQDQDSQVQHMIEQQDDQQQKNYLFTRLSEQPQILKGGELKYYQLVGLNWMISLYQSGINGILADDMGLGKTIQTIAIIAFIRQYKKINGPHIIIAPKITLGNWVNQFEKWLPQCKVVKLIATRQERQEILAQQVNNGNFQVLVTSFQGVRICLNSLKKIKWHYIVIDQAHKIKNQDSQLSQVVRKLHTQCKLLLTGTPLQNNLHQLWSLLNFLLPDIFNTSEMFDNWFSVAANNSSEGKGGDGGNQGDKSIALTQEQIQKRNTQMIHQLHKILKPFMLRRTKLQVEKSLPPKKQVHIYVGMTDCQLKVYKNLLQNRSSSQDQKKFYLNLLMQLRKACNHPYLFPGIQDQTAPSLGQHIIDNSGKMIVLDRLLRKLFKEGGHRVLIFSQMTMVLDILEDYCNYREYHYCRIDGSTDMDSRDRQIEEFMTPGTDKFIFLLSTRAGGLGINLTAADTVIIYDSDWNPQMDLQAMDRAHRIGQKNLVNVYRLITQNTIQQKIIQRQTIKLKWDHLVIQQAKNSQKNKALTKQQMKDMLQFGASIIIKANKGTITDQQIDVILQRGQNRTKQLNMQVQQKLKTGQQNLSDLSMNSINIFDFMMQDQYKKKQDAQALDQIYARQLGAQIRTRRQKQKNINYQIDPNNKNKKDTNIKDRKILVPQYHFYQNRDILQDLLQKQTDYQQTRNTDKPTESLTQTQEEIKDKLLSTGFKDWTKNDFLTFVSGCDKFGRNNLKEISQAVGKTIQEVTQYSKVFWQRIEQLSQKDKILKQITNGQQKIQTRKQHKELLQWKASQCYQIDFNPQVYTKFKSKLFSIDADRFVAQKLYKAGITNMYAVRQKVRNEPMFRFDHYFRSRTQSQLSKRMLSIYRLIEKEKDYLNLGMDTQWMKQAKKKNKKKKKIQEKQDGSDKGKSIIDNNDDDNQVDNQIDQIDEGRDQDNDNDGEESKIKSENKSIRSQNKDKFIELSEDSPSKSYNKKNTNKKTQQTSLKNFIKIKTAQKQEPIDLEAQEDSV